MSAYKAQIHSQHDWSVKSHTGRHSTAAALEKQSQKDGAVITTLKRKLHDAQVAASNTRNSRDGWKSRAHASANQCRSLSHNRVRVQSAVDRLSFQLIGIRKARDTYYQKSFRMGCKKRALEVSGRWDLRAPLVNLLSKEDRKRVCIAHVLSRIKDGSNYSDLSVNYGPKIIQDWDISANNLRESMPDAFKWMVAEDEFSHSGLDDCVMSSCCQVINLEGTDPKQID